MKEMSFKDFINLNPDTYTLIDIREEMHYKMGTINGAQNIPLNNIRLLYKLPKDKPVYVFCHTGESSIEITQLLEDAGYDAYSLIGGYREYLKTLA